jgi:hypothetical protein
MPVWSFIVDAKMDYVICQKIFFHTFSIFGKDGVKDLATKSWHSAGTINYNNCTYFIPIKKP